MIPGAAPIGSTSLGAFPPLPRQIEHAAKTANLAVSGIIIPERKTFDGVLLKSTSAIWFEISQRLQNDWSVAYQLSSENWEEIVAGAFKSPAIT